MDHRRQSHADFSRPPLGDATDRVLNTPPRKSHKRRRTQELNPLRAHPAPSETGPITAPNLIQDPSLAASNKHRISAISQEEKEADKRDSQISTSTASSGKRKTHIGPWQLGKTLGKGSAARVRLARHALTHELAAVKILSKISCQMNQAGSLAALDKYDRRQPEFEEENRIPLSIEREVAILKLIDHPNIVKMYDIWENRSEIYLVLEYVENGDLFEYINNSGGGMAEEEAIYYFRQILSALEYVHSFNLCHRDLKPENILMKEDGQVKVADFGMAAIQQSPTHLLRTSCGSPHYAAPELVGKGRYRGNQVDIWSLGVILYACLCARLPFDDNSVPKLLAKAQKGVYDIPDWLGREAKDLIKRMLQVDPQKRITIRDIWKHPVVRKYDAFDDLSTPNLPQELRNTADYSPLTAEDIDMQTLRQLKAIWHHYTEKELALRLVSPDPTDQKLFYWLLFNYRQKRLENYNTMELSHSASDFHHLRPAQWKKKFTTLEFPSRYGRSASRFTVISNVASNVEDDALETATEGGGTERSYDPYKSSFVMGNGTVASHAKIVIHRNGSISTASYKPSSSLRRRVGSVRSSSSTLRQLRQRHNITTPSTIRASRRSLGSTRSGDSTPYKRPASSRHRRGVDFSHVRRRSLGHQREYEARQAPANIAGDDLGPVRVSSSPKSLFKDTRASTRSGRGRARAGTQSMTDISFLDTTWDEELTQISHSIAKDCDDAFNSSYYSTRTVENRPISTLDTSTAELPYDFSSRPLTMGTPTPQQRSADAPAVVSYPWDMRPLPTPPPPTDSVLNEILQAKNRTTLRRGEPDQSPGHVERVISHLEELMKPGPFSIIKKTEPDRRVVSAPIYSQYSTQWGKDKIPLPSIDEAQREDSSLGDRERSRIVSAPPEVDNGLPAPERDHQALDYLSRHQNTIRLVMSPGADLSPVRMPAPLNVRKKSSRRVTDIPQAAQETNLRQQYLNDEVRNAVNEQRSSALSNGTSVITEGVQKKRSWFKRRSRDKDDVFVSGSRTGSSSNKTDTSDGMECRTFGGSDIPPVKKKNFSLAFWRSSKEMPPMQLSLAGPEVADSPSPNPPRIFSHPTRYKKSREVDEAIRDIEPRQNWLARLFRVKPATKCLCFSISRRRARQEIAILLKEWRKYGIRDVQVDKERNLVFARVAAKNYLHMREVDFATEIMAVIEHGKKSQLCIVRFTQERGSASSFNKVIDTIKLVFGARNLLVTDAAKVKMMIKTLSLSDPKRSK